MRWSTARPYRRVSQNQRMCEGSEARSQETNGAKETERVSQNHQVEWFFVEHKTKIVWNLRTASVDVYVGIEALTSLSRNSVDC